MADKPQRMTTATVDPKARAEFEEKWRQQGLPFKARPLPPPTGRRPSVWMQMIAAFDTAMQSVQRSLMGGRLVDTQDRGNVGSGYGGRERAAAQQDIVTEMETGRKPK